MLRALLNPWLLIPLAGLIAALMLWRQQAQVPTRADWRAATEYVRAEIEANDGVTWAPYWAGEGRLFLHDLPAFHTPDVKTADWARYSHVWLLGAFGWTAADLPPGHSVVGATQKFGGITVQRVAVPGPHVVADLYSGLDKAQVSRVQKGQTKRCTFWDGKGWHCDPKLSPEATLKCLNQPANRLLSKARRAKCRGRDCDARSVCGLNYWMNVSRDVRMIGRYPRRCVWFHPRAGAIKRIEWPDVPAGTTTIEYGFADRVIVMLPKAPVVKPVTLTVRRSATEIGKIVAEPVEGWHRVELPQSDSGTLIFDLETSSHRDGFFCFDATVRQ